MRICSSQGVIHHFTDSLILGFSLTEHTNIGEEHG